MKKKRIVILGAGFGGVYTARRLHKLFHKDNSIEIVLINRTNYFLFTPLLHEVATGSIAPANIVEPLRKVVGCCLAEFHMDEIKKISFKNKTVKTGQCLIPYDYLVVALGAETNFYGTPGADKHCYTLKTMDDAIMLKNHFIQMYEDASTELDSEKRKQMLSFVVVGGGPTGVELAAEMSEFFFDTFCQYFRSELLAETTITLVQKANELIPQFAKPLRDKSLSALKKHGVHVRFNTHATDVTKDSVTLNTGESIKTNTVIWTAGVAACPLNCDVDIPREKNGKIIVNEYLQLPEHPDVFVLGDVASIRSNDTGEPVPALAQAATKQGHHTANNIRHVLREESLKPYTYKHDGSLISFGNWQAGADINGRSFEGKLTWWFWRTIYLTKLISFTKKVQVAVDWTLNLFTARDISRVYTDINKKRK